MDACLSFEVCFEEPLVDLMALLKKKTYFLKAAIKIHITFILLHYV